jgi:myb proto-oncogene protein
VSQSVTDAMSRRNPWTNEEEQALLAGIEVHGPGKWQKILCDPRFSRQLSERTNINLKDKYR